MGFEGNRNTGTTVTLEDGVRRFEKPVYPTEVLREAVVNALVHRDYLLIPAVCHCYSSPV